MGFDWDSIVTEPRATLDEVKEFCNKVRRAGEGDLIEALLPAAPRDPSSCLIAKNLNFSCRVGSGWPKGNGGDPLCYPNDKGTDYKWYMFVGSPAREQIANALDLAIERVQYGNFSSGLEKAILLPQEIGRVAMAFDKWYSIAQSKAWGNPGRLIETSDEFYPFLDSARVPSTVFAKES